MCTCYSFKLGTVHYLLGVRDRCFGVRDKDFFLMLPSTGHKDFLCFYGTGHELFLEKNLSNYICINLSWGAHSHRLGYEMCHF